MKTKKKWDADDCRTEINDLIASAKRFHSDDQRAMLAGVLSDIQDRLAELGVVAAVSMNWSLPSKKGR